MSGLCQSFVFELVRADHIVLKQSFRCSQSGFLILVACVATLVIAPQWVSAQAPATRPKPAAKPAAKPPAKGKEDPKLTPRWVPMTTKDGVQIRAFYAPSPKGKDAVPVMIIHEWQGQGSPYVGLVKALNEAGCAVIVPEYRGHGASQKYTDSSGRQQEFNIALMGRADAANIIRFDLEEVKQFLKKENNAGNLNLNALTLVGIREGAVFAANWAINDWGFPSVGKIKQGQDVKALVFVSPVKNAEGFPIDAAIRHQVLINLPVMVVAGSESVEAVEAARISKQLESQKKRVSRGEAANFEQKTIPTSLSGPALVVSGPGVLPAITAFITSNVKSSDASNAWIERQ